MHSRGKSNVVSVAPVRSSCKYEDVCGVGLEDGLSQITRFLLKARRYRYDVDVPNFYRMSDRLCNESVKAS